MKAGVEPTNGPSGCARTYVMMRVASVTDTFMYSASVATFADRHRGHRAALRDRENVAARRGGSRRDPQLRAVLRELVPGRFRRVDAPACRCARLVSLPSKFGSANAVVSITFERWGISARLTGCSMSVSSKLVGSRSARCR